MKIYKFKYDTIFVLIPTITIYWGFNKNMITIGFLWLKYGIKIIF